jgi:hypothetical protein
MKSEKSLPIRLLEGFGQFWWDFLIGDTPELFVAALVIIGVIALLSRAGHDNAAAVVTLPLLVVIALAVSVRRAQQASRRK